MTPIGASGFFFFNVLKYTHILVTILPEAYKNKCIICNVTKITLIYVKILPRAFMPGHDRNKNQCIFCNIILGQVTLSPTGSHLLHCILYLGWFCKY